MIYLVSLTVSIINIFLAAYLLYLTSLKRRKIKVVISLNITCALILAMLSTYGQYHGKIVDQLHRQAELGLDVTENIASRRMTIFDNYFYIYRNSLLINNYIRYQNALSHLSPEARAAASWENAVSQDQQHVLKGVRNALDRLKVEAKEILDLSIRYPKYVPEAIQKWAYLTLDIEFSELPQFINAYRSSRKARKYAFLLGFGAGETIASVKGSVEAISK